MRISGITTHSGPSHKHYRGMDRAIWREMRKTHWLHDGSALGKYGVQMLAAHRRGIPWHFTPETWWAVWKASGKYERRGTGRGQYVMARKGDAGPYSPDNVEIITSAQNVLDGFRNRAARRFKAFMEVV